MSNCCCSEEHLTVHELDALELVAAGLTNQQIGRRLSRSEHTIAGQIASAMHRLDAHTRTELTARCYTAGVLDVGLWPPGRSGRRCLPAVGNLPLSGPTLATPPLTADGAS